jgi:membrane-bound lytic murein transglycosylase D
MNRIITIVLTVFMLVVWPFCQVIASQPGNNQADSGEDTAIDSLLNTWFIEKMLDLNTTYSTNLADTMVPVYPDSVYIARIDSLSSYIPLKYNKIVRNFIHVYTVKKRSKLELILGLKDYYFPIFEEIIDSYGLPIELKFMPVIESALNPRAVSRAGATGLWQFMYGTGKMYKLNINSYIDERRDPVLSTHAACQYLRDMYKIYNDWILVIAAYNCGPRNVNRAIRRAGGKRDYWDIYYYLPRETRGYVPAFIGAMYAIEYYKYHNVQPVKTNLPIVTDTIMVNRDLHFKQVSVVVGVPLNNLRDLNPMFKADILPGKIKAYPLVIPLQYSADFITFEDSVYAYKDSILLNNQEILKNPEKFTTTSYYHKPPAGNFEKLHYVVKSGDNLGYISEWYNVRASDIRYWNNIYGNLIKGGQQLVIYVPKDKVNYYKVVNDLSFEQKRIGKTVVQSNSVPVPKGETDFVYYTVRSGDTLWEIAKKFPGTTDTDIMKLNNIGVNEKIKPGQVLKIKRKG